MNEFILINNRYNKGKLLIKTGDILYAKDIFKIEDGIKRIFAYTEIAIRQKLNDTILESSERAVDICNKINAIKKY